MIKFFRKRRQKLLTENKFRKYLLYAIGEIALVVIGILIALQINTWNEQRKLKTKELKSLQELRSDLVQNLNDMRINIASFMICKNSNEIIVYNIENNIKYNDSLDYHFSMLYPFITFSVNQTAYDNLKLNGIGLITNDSLRRSISDLYANRFQSYMTFENTYMVSHYKDFIKPIFISEFSTYEYTVAAKPKNYAEFITNSEYKQVLNFTIDICNNFIRFQTDLKERTQEIIKRIDKEISD